jgi:hypothetical protein
LKIPAFGELLKRIRHLEFKTFTAKQKQILQDKEDGMYPFNKKTFKKSSPIQPILPLIRIAATAEDDKEKTKFITFTLKVRAGGNAASPTYKKAMQIFEDGTPQEWMDVLTGVREIWRQNAIANAQDRAATVAAIIKGDSLTAFEAAIETPTIQAYYKP